MFLVTEAKIGRYELRDSFLGSLQLVKIAEPKLEDVRLRLKMFKVMIFIWKKNI